MNYTSVLMAINQIIVIVTVALYLYDLASRLAGDCLLGEEEEEGRR